MARKDLARVLDDPDPWTPLHELAVDPPADLVAVIRDSYVAAGISSQQRRLLAWLLENLRHIGADSLVPELLSDADGADAAALLRTAVRRGVAISAVELVRLPTWISNTSPIPPAPGGGAAWIAEAMTTAGSTG